MRRIAVVGGGASGLAAACAAARAAALSGLPCQVTVYESDERVGRTILATGNGRCNLSNSQLDVSLFHNAAFVGKALQALEASVAARGEGIEGDEGGAEAAANAEAAAAKPCETPDFLFVPDNAVMAFFADLGLAWRAESEGRLYPLANKASAVLDVLRARARALGVAEECNARVKAIDPPRDSQVPFTLRMADGAFVRADAVVLAAGGRCAAGLLPAGFGFADPVPVLAPLRTEGFPVKQLDGVRVRCAVTLEQVSRADQPQGKKAGRNREVRLSAGTPVAVERGEVLFRKYGVSGIAVFNLSRYACPGMQLAIDLMPDVELAELETILLERVDRLGAFEPATLEVILRGLMLPSIAKALCDHANLDLDGFATAERVKLLAALLKGLRLRVAGIGDEHQSQVRRGGFDVAAFDPRTMVARDVPGLYAAGEALDVDGPCGGYNLHWAWASGLLAGTSAVSWLEGL